MNLIIQGANKGIPALSGVDMDLVAKLAQDLAMGNDSERSIDENYGDEIYQAVMQYVKGNISTKPTALPQPIRSTSELISEALSRFALADKESWVEFSKGVVKMYGTPAGISFWNAYLALVAENSKTVMFCEGGNGRNSGSGIETPSNTDYSPPRPQENAKPAEPKTSNKMLAWIVGIGAAVSLYAISKKGKGLSGFGCACDDDKPKPMAGVKTKNRKKAKSKSFTLKM